MKVSKSRAKAAPKSKAKADPKAKPKCIGKVGSGAPCTKNAKDNSKWCTIHDPTYVRKKIDPNAKKTKQAKQDATMALIASKINSSADLGKWAEDDALAKKIDPTNAIQVASFIRAEMPRRVRRLALLEHDVYPYISASSTSVESVNSKGPEAWSRKIWMMISWHLITDLKAYEALAMSCKKIYKVLLLDKVTHHYSPLKGIIKSPRIFFMPVYRIVEFQLSDNFESIATSNGLPTIKSMKAAYADAKGPVKSPLEDAQRTCDIIITLLQGIVQKTLDPEEDFEEEIPGCGVLGRAKANTMPRFENCDVDVNLYRVQSDTFLVAKCYSFAKHVQIERTLSDSLWSYDGKRVIQLMRV